MDLPVTLQRWDDRTNARVGVFNGAAYAVDPGWQFGAPQHVIQEFIRTPRAVRVWYYTRCRPCMPSNRYGCAPGEGLSCTPSYDFFRVFVIVDQTRSKGLTIGQFADYVSMVSLAEIKPEVHLGGAPTILKLFNGAPYAAPAGMTDWDQGFLKSLYETPQKRMVQRRRIAHDMLRAIVH